MSQREMFEDPAQRWIDACGGDVELGRAQMAVAQFVTDEMQRWLQTQPLAPEPVRRPVVFDDGGVMSWPTDTYEQALRKARRMAWNSRRDVGIERREVAGRGGRPSGWPVSWKVSFLPPEHERCGWELRCQVVRPTEWTEPK